MYPVDLAFGMRGPEVGNWQRFLNTQGATLDVDEQFGMHTKLATMAYQMNETIPKSGAVGPLTRKLAIAQGFIPFLSARNYTIAERGLSDVRVIVIHTMEAPDKPTTAMAIGEWFHGDSSPKASAHYGVDEIEIVQYVRERDVAWHAPGANNDGIGIEHAGYASFKEIDWDADDVRAMLAISAKLAARICRDYQIPLVRLSIDDLLQKKRGLCGHVDVTNAFSNGVGHQDPGPNFPWDTYLEMIMKEGATS